MPWEGRPGFQAAPAASTSPAREAAQPGAAMLRGEVRQGGGEVKCSSENVTSELEANVKPRVI